MTNIKDNNDFWKKNGSNEYFTKKVYYLKLEYKIRLLYIIYTSSMSACTRNA
jgi:hypothetical protein